ncbi:alpha/beta hydrolase [Bdellovibrio sp. SKB1291214]|uniref:alpha/beta fold hydrolase n=1 Tax=Bdellovibrio sp. SKB1291214 TaxID=1732569 RepID=UPI000B5154E8|nr:alpha/beta hydrolase [Bdellovibrio sp. SKB1291214]UYL09646.1 alpha/beta hydrolase [Bdellovibrio sp. SKB1291214]
MSHKITYRERGSGPILLLLHGYGGSVHHWEGIAAHLEQHYRVVIPNLSHIYMSSDKLFFTVQVEVLARFIKEHFPDERVHVAGLSYGGALSWGLATMHPQLVRKMALINPMVTDPVKKFMPKELRFFFSIPLNLKSIYIMLSTPMGASFLKRAAQIFRDERSEGAVSVERLKGRKLQFVAHMIHHFSWILRSEDWQAWNRKLFNYRGECRLIFDESDLLFNQEAYRGFAKHLGCEDLIVLKGAGHLAIKSQPDQVAHHLIEFLNAATNFEKMAK